LPVEEEERLVPVCLPDACCMPSRKLLSCHSVFLTHCIY
jgi:hypothetical protein